MSAHSNFSQRLEELGIVLPVVAAPVGAYVPAVRSGNQAWTSGQLPFVDGVIGVTGKVGTGKPGLVDPETASAMARICVLNALSAVVANVGSLDQIRRIVKITGYVASDPEFTGQPGVVNGASVVLGEIFGEAGIHARSAVGVTVLPLDAPVEIELMVEVD